MCVVHQRIRALTRRRLNRYASRRLHPRGVRRYTLLRYQTNRRSRQVMACADLLHGARRLSFATRRSRPCGSPSRPADLRLRLVQRRRVNSLWSGRCCGPTATSMRLQLSGTPGRRWIDYDFRDCLKDVPKNFVILPVIYDVDPLVFHRVTSVMETFNLPVRWPCPRPSWSQPDVPAVTGFWRTSAARGARRRVLPFRYEIVRLHLSRT